MARKLTIDEVKSRINKVNENLLILDNDYSGANHKLKTKCKKCGYIWGISYSKIMSGRSCPSCFNKRRGDNRKLSLATIKNNVYKINPKIKILDDKYINNKTKLTCLCLQCNETWKVNYDKLQQRRGCPHCDIKRRADLKRQDISTIIEKIKNINPNIEIIDTHYINCHKKLKCKCKVCSNIWEVKWTNLFIGRGCPKCSVSRRSGKNNHNYNPNLTKEERIKSRSMLYGDNMTKWRNSVFKRDDFTCKICNKKGTYLNAHHLNSYHAHPKERFDLNNGVTLCKKHHRDFHKRYGYKNNTKEQFEEYLKSIQ